MMIMSNPAIMSREYFLADFTSSPKIYGLLITTAGVLLTATKPASKL
jgi:hypothetical protein